MRKISVIFGILSVYKQYSPDLLTVWLCQLLTSGHPRERTKGIMALGFAHLCLGFHQPLTPTSYPSQPLPLPIPISTSYPPLLCHTLREGKVEGVGCPLVAISMLSCVLAMQNKTTMPCVTFTYPEVCHTLDNFILTDL